MNTQEYKNKLEQMVHHYLYVSSKKTKEMEENIEQIQKYLLHSSDYMEAIRNIFINKTNENMIGYHYFLHLILEKCPKEVTLSILTIPDKYEDILKEESFYLQLWSQLSFKDKIEYLKGKKKYSDLDIACISLCCQDTEQNKKFIKEIKKEESILSKIPNFVLQIPTSILESTCISLQDFSICNKIQRPNYTKAILKQYSSFEAFLSFYNKNKEVFYLIDAYSLSFPTQDNEAIYSFLLENENWIGKFQKQYLDLFSIAEIKQFIKNESMQAESYSAILNKLYCYNPKEVSYLLDEKHLLLTAKHSLSFNPFAYIDEKTRNHIFSNYKLLNRFLDTVLIEAIHEYLGEEDIVNLLRNDLFVMETSSYAIELILNQLPFLAAFNMLQRKNILDKIEHLNIAVSDKDIVFLHGFLDSPNLVCKSGHTMLYSIFMLLNTNDICYYLVLPYIIDNLSTTEIIQILIKKNISILPFLEEQNALFEKFETITIAKYVDAYLKQTGDLKLFLNPLLTSLLFSDIPLEEVNFQEVNYLYETIHMKDILSKQETEVTLSSYKSVLTSYLILGLEKTIAFINEGNRSVTLPQVLELEKHIVEHQLLDFKQKNSYIFQNIHKEITERLLAIPDKKNIEDFYSACLQEEYLKKIIDLMLEMQYAPTSIIMKNFYTFVSFYEDNAYASLKEMYTFIHTFISVYLGKIKSTYLREFDKKIKQHFKLKDSIIYKKQKELSKEYLQKLKLKIFIQALTEKNKEKFIPYFVDTVSLNTIKDIYMKKMASYKISFENILEHILMPLANERFSNENCLQKLGIVKPNNYDTYLDYLSDLQTVTHLNFTFQTLKTDRKEEELVSIMNHILYNVAIPFKVKANEKKPISSCIDYVMKMHHSLFIDKSDLSFRYENDLDIYNMDDLSEYKKYNELLDSIIKKTYTFINNCMKEDILKVNFNKQYLKYINTKDLDLPISTNTYELQKRVFSIQDLERIFSGFQFSNFSTLKELSLFSTSNLIMLAEGYYEGIVDNFGTILSQWKDIIHYLNLLNKEISTLSLLDLEEIFQLLTMGDNPLNQLIPKDIISTLYEEGYYEMELSKRFVVLQTLYKKSYERISSTVPFTSYTNNTIVIRVIDSYTHDDLRICSNDVYQIGKIGNNFLQYTILNKNGFQVGVYEDNKLVGKILGCRNGNAIFLNGYLGKYIDHLDTSLKEFANQMIEDTKMQKEPIQYILLVNNTTLSYPNDPIIDKTIVPWVNYPIPTQYTDYFTFKQEDSLLEQESMFTNYNDYITTLLSSSGIVDKTMFLQYDAEDIYYRPRNKVRTLGTNMNAQEAKQLQTILYLLDNSSIDFNIFDTLYLGDDFIIGFKDKEKEVYQLPYDFRAYEEIKQIHNN